LKLQTYFFNDRFEAALGDSLTSADLNAFRDLLAEMKKSKCKVMLLDLSNLNWIDSAGLGMLLLAKETSEKAGLDFVVRSPKGDVKSLLELGRFDKIFNIEMT
jgi:anti-anti-sigma factor